MNDENGERECSRPAIPAEEAWEVVMSRDRSWDGKLFYAVRTTGIYCRPSCPSRRPKRENVEFFATAERAERAGYRACHRCHPDSLSGTPTERRLRKAMEHLREHVDESVTLEQLGEAVGLSPTHLQRAFRDAVGLSPRAYQDAYRLELLKRGLRQGDDVGRAAWRAGYGSMRGAYESAANGIGMTPGQYKHGGRGVAIRYAVQESRFGHVIAAWTRKGVCAVLLGDSEEEVVAALEGEFPRAELRREQPQAAAGLRAVLDYLEGTHPGLVVPLDLQGSNFQLRVWRALQRIPIGEVRSYREVAEAIGAPRSARAVAAACGANRVALAVPCHRVVGSDGALRGYRWGTDRKRRLLEHERRLRGRGTGG
ncbi:MAG: bifunctional DNA-binding transcriptional regulator/O6-methylguanine-DNA methyltransferase Ada [Gemmatimonadota bacterium]